MRQGILIPTGAVHVVTLTAQFVSAHTIPWRASEASQIGLHRGQARLIVPQISSRTCPDSDRSAARRNVGLRRDMNRSGVFR